SGTGIKPPTSRSEDDPLPPEPRSPMAQVVVVARGSGGRTHGGRGQRDHQDFSLLSLQRDSNGAHHRVRLFPRVQIYIETHITGILTHINQKIWKWDILLLQMYNILLQ
uniref:Uncharacterized protein n=1 Tax=Gouania willdenowi TaxID=441366 RepID=A0A8C5H6T7_GOUWI